jgi:hypothetical protein
MPVAIYDALSAIDVPPEKVRVVVQSMERDMALFATRSQFSALDEHSSASFNLLRAEMAGMREQAASFREQVDRRFDQVDERFKLIGGRFDWMHSEIIIFAPADCSARSRPESRKWNLSRRACPKWY